MTVGQEASLVPPENPAGEQLGVETGEARADPCADEPLARAAHEIVNGLHGPSYCAVSD